MAGAEGIDVEESLKRSLLTKYDRLKKYLLPKSKYMDMISQIKEATATTGQKTALQYKLLSK